MSQAQTAQHRRNDSMSSGWDTDKRDVYGRFRRLPFDDLMDLIEPGPRPCSISAAVPPR
jgi:hypothetical protein